MADLQTERIEVRVTPEEKAELELRANASGIKLSDYVRQASLDRIGRGRQSDLVEADVAADQRVVPQFEQRVRELSRMMPRSGAEGQARKEGLRP
jgi:uncharacterized protein (DUF1778 family)